jgi:integrase
MTTTRRRPASPLPAHGRRPSGAAQPSGAVRPVPGRGRLEGTEWEGLHPHAFRRLVATRLDAKGLSAREIADYLGHERVSMTQDVYMARRVTGAVAANAMESLGPIESGG